MQYTILWSGSFLRSIISGKHKNDYYVESLILVRVICDAVLLQNCSSFTSPSVTDNSMYAQIHIHVQFSLIIAVSVMLGNLIDYFGIEDPTEADTRNAYFYGAGK